MESSRRRSTCLVCMPLQTRTTRRSIPMPGCQQTFFVQCCAKRKLLSRNGTRSSCHPTNSVKTSNKLTDPTRDDRPLASIIFDSSTGCWWKGCQSPLTTALHRQRPVHYMSYLWVKTSQLYKQNVWRKITRNKEFRSNIALPIQYLNYYGRGKIIQ